ncbi:MAG: hypothetical protein R3D66_06715 [Alphaproteobacteria bacterium]
MTGSKKIESLITRELLPVLDPDNKAESFLACNLIRHSRNSKDFVVDTANYDFLTRKNLFPGLPEKLFRRFAKKYKGSAFGDYCAFVTDHDSDIVKEMTKHPPSTRSIIFNTTFDGYLP